MTQLYVCHDVFTWLIYVYDTINLHDSFIWVLSLLHITHPCARHDSCIPLLLHVRDMTPSHYYSSAWCNWWTWLEDMTHWYVWYDSLVCVIWLIGMCDMTHSPSHSCACHDSFTLLIYVCVMTHAHDLLICVTWHIHMTHFCVCHDSITGLGHMCDMPHLHVMCVTHIIHGYDITGLGHMCDMPHLHVVFVCEMTRYSFISVTCLMCICDMTHSYLWLDSSHVWHASFACRIVVFVCNMTQGHDSFMCVTHIIHGYDITDITHSHDLFKCVKRLVHVWNVSHLHDTCLICLICTTRHIYVYGMTKVHASFMCVTRLPTVLLIDIIWLCMCVCVCVCAHSCLTIRGW